MLPTNQNYKDRGEIVKIMTIPQNLACKEGLVYVPKRSCRTCCQNRYVHHTVIVKGEDLLAFILAV